MGYEISGALGIKMAKPDQDVVVFLGDGSYLLSNSDIYSSVLYDQKLIIVVCDNGGHMVINRLQLAKGGKEYICNLRAARATNLQFVDFENHAKSMGQMRRLSALHLNLRLHINELKTLIKPM